MNKIQKVHSAQFTTTISLHSFRGGFRLTSIVHFYTGNFCTNSPEFYEKEAEAIKAFNTAVALAA